MEIIILHAENKKGSGTIYWPSPNIGATNESGFTDLPGGYRNPFGSFNEIAFSGFWWTAEGFCRQMSCGFKIFSLAQAIRELDYLYVVCEIYD